MATVKKKDFKSKLEAFKAKNSTTTKYKPQEYLSCGAVFGAVAGVPGPAIGHINMFLGHSNTGKTTSLIASAIDSQKKGRLPVFCITEQKWDFEHLKLMGFDCEKNEETGEWEGPFLFKNDFLYVEQVTDYINSLLDQQAKNEIDMGMDFFWDSVGSIPCKMTYEGKGGKQHTAGVLAEKIGMGLNQRITGSRFLTAPYTNTLVVINQPWVERPANPMGQPKIKPKGGEAFYLNSTLVFIFGNQAASGVTKLDATLNGRKVAYATRTKVTVDKNHINGLGFKDGKIIVTPHGYIFDTKTDIDAYKDTCKDYWQKLFGVDDLTGMVLEEIDDQVDAVTYED